MSATRRLLMHGLNVAVLFLAWGCLSSPPTALDSHLQGEGRRVLFIGNSYLYANDIPSIVQALADSANGDKLAVQTVAGPDMALVDHWNEGTARREIAKGGWEWVVLQQGPSSVAVNRDTLRMLTKLFADDMKLVNARPALFSAWPAEANFSTFDAAIQSYVLASQDVGGLFIPVASAWLSALRRDPNIRLYSDGLHPSTAGAYLSSLVVYARLMGRTPKGLPAQLRLHSGQLLTLDLATAQLLQGAAAEVTGYP